MRKLTWWLLFLTLTPLWGSGLLLDRDLEYQMLADIHERLELALHAHQQYLRLILQHQRDDLGVVARRVAHQLTSGMPLHPDFFSDMLPQAVGCQVYDGQGRVASRGGEPFTAREPGTLPRALVSDPFLEPTDPSGRSVYEMSLPLTQTISRPQGAATRSPSDRSMGTVVCRVKSLLSELLATHREGLKLTGEVYLVSAKTHLMLTESRFIPHAIGRVKVDTVGLHEALTMRNSVLFYRDYRGAPVIGVFLYLRDYDWVLLAEIDEAEVLAPLMRMRRSLGTILILISLAAGVAAWRFGHHLTAANRRLDEARSKAEVAQARMEILLNAMADAVFEIDETSTVLLANTAAHRMFGWPDGALIGQKVTVLMPFTERGKHEAGIRRYLETGESRLIGQVVEVTGLKKDGTLVSCELSLAVLKGPEGSRRFIGLNRDITERKMMETQSRRLERLAAMGQLLGGIAHEVRNPVFILTGRLQLLHEKLASREYDQLGGDLLKIEAAAQRIATVVQRFLSLARPSRLNVEPCLVQEVLQEVCGFLANECLTQHVRVDTSWSATLPPVRADRHQLGEAVMNLMLNAIQAMAAAHGGGTLTVRARCPPSAQDQGGPWIEVRIQDDGPGIAPEHRAKLFQPFFSTKPPEQGTGLGLWMVRTFVMTLQGTVDYETEVGRGTTFIVRLPVLSPAQPGTNTSPAG